MDKIQNKDNNVCMASLYHNDFHPIPVFSMVQKVRTLYE